MSARTTALSALIACRTRGAWSDGILKEYILRDRLDRRDSALASRLCYGVLQNRMLLDFYIAAFLKGKLRDLQPVVLDILRLGVYQLTMTDRIPAAACVNEAVEQGKKYANRKAAGLINGVLRSIARADSLPEPPDLATRYSHPQPLVDLLRESVGDALLPALLASHNTAPHTAVQVNTVKITAAEAAERMEKQGVGVEKHPWLPDCYYLTGTGSIEALEVYREGLVYVQDPAARLAAMAAALAPGMRVLDCCAAPGGKSFAAAIQMNDRGSVTSCDVHPHKIDLLRKGADRLGLTSIHPLLHDAREPEAAWENAMDAVIADVPCSGLGVIRKKPDVRYKDLSRISALPEIQLAILDRQAGYVRPGGVLVYSTCTILKQENEGVVEAFLDRHPEFTPERIALPEGCGAEGAMLTLLPCVHDTDGFFIAKLRKKP